VRARCGSHGHSRVRIIPIYQKDRIERAREQNTPDYFAQEYEADFTRATGLAFKMWNREYNLIPEFEVPEEWKRGRGFDYGSNDPTASVRIAIDNEDNWFVERCYKAGGQAIRDHANVILAQDYGHSIHSYLRRPFRGSMGEGVCPEQCEHIAS